MTDHAAFSHVVEEDIAALHACGVGIVLVGPLRSLAGLGRLDADRFDHQQIEALSITDVMAGALSACEGREHPGTQILDNTVLHPFMLRAAGL